MKPAARPACAHFSSGPCAKIPGWTTNLLNTESLGRSHRSSLGKARLKRAITLTREVLEVPDTHLIGIVPEEGRGISWANQFLVWPLETPIMVHAGDHLQVTFSYEAGAPLSALSSHLNVIHLPHQARRAA